MTGSNLRWILCAVQDFDISVSRAMELIECDRSGKFTDDMMPADACSRRVFGFDDDELELRADIFRDMINELRDTAKTFHNHDSLRERLRGVVNKFIKVQL